MSYLAEVIADAPQHYWRCADQAGRVLNDIGSAPHALHIVGGSPQLGYSGPVSNGGSFDVALNGEFANTGETIHFGGGAVAVELIAWSWQAKTVANQWAFFNPAAGQISLFNDGTDWRFLYSGVFVPNPGATGVADQAWTHLVGTYDGANARLYVNGAQSGAAVAIAPTAAGDFTFSVCQNVANGSRGFVSEIAWYTHGLSAARVAAHFAAIDQIAQPPVAGAAGGLSGAPGGSAYTGLLQTILQSVRKVY